MSANPDGSGQDELLKLTGDIAAAYVSNNSVPVNELSFLIKNVHAALTAIVSSASEALLAQKPAVPIKKSVTNEYVICLEDGVRLKMLKRYLRSNYNLTPEEYRAKWSLPADYPMVAPNYSSQRSDFAKKIGLGKKRQSRVGVHDRRRASYGAPQWLLFGSKATSRSKTQLGLSAALVGQH